MLRFIEAFVDGGEIAAAGFVRVSAEIASWEYRRQELGQKALVRQSAPVYLPIGFHVPVKGRVSPLPGSDPAFFYTRQEPGEKTGQRQEAAKPVDAFDADAVR